MTTSKARIEVPTAAGRSGRLYIDGKHVSGVLAVSVDIQASAGVQMTVTHRLGAFEADLDKAKVLLDEKTRNTLQALGWTPPEDEEPADVD